MECLCSRLLSRLRLSGPAAALFAGILFFILPGRSLAAVSELRQIVQDLNAWRASFANIQVVWELRNVGKSREAQAGGQTIPPFVRHEWIWADQGLMRFDVESLKDGRPQRQDSHGWNVPQALSFSAEYPPQVGDLSAPTHLELRRQDGGRPTTSFAVTPLGGLFFGAVGKWLGEILAETKVDLDSHREWRGERCVRIVLSDWEGAEIWLDPVHDYLVRRYYLSDMARRLGTETTVEDFQRLPNGVWFPKRGQFRVLRESPEEATEWVVTRVAVNQALDERLFQPPQTRDGTVVSDTRNGHVYRVGQPSNRREVEAKIVEEAKANVVGDPHAFSARLPPSHGLWWTGGLFIVSLVALGVGIWLRRKTGSG